MSSINDTFLLDPSASINNIKSSHNQFINEIKNTSLYNLLKNSKMKYVYRYSTAPTGWVLDAQLGQINIDRTNKYSVLEFENSNNETGQTVSQNITDVLEPNTKYTFYFDIESTEDVKLKLVSTTGILLLSPSTEISFSPTISVSRHSNYITFLTDNTFSTVNITIENDSTNDNDVTIRKMALVKGGVEFLDVLDTAFFIECLVYTHDPDQDALGEWSWKITEDGITYKRLFNVSKIDDDYYYDSSYNIDADKGYVTLKDNSETVLRDIDTDINYKVSVHAGFLIIEELPSNVIPAKSAGISLRNEENTKCFTLRIKNKAVELHEIPYDSSMDQQTELIDYRTGIIYTMTFFNNGIELTLTRAEAHNGVILDTVNGNKYFLSVVSNAITTNLCNSSAIAGTGIFIRDKITTNCYRLKTTNGVIGVTSVAFNEIYEYCVRVKDYTNNYNYIITCASGVLQLTRVGTSNIDADTLDGLDSTDFVRTTTYTANDILTKIKTVDGTGTGLDADKLDGFDADYFVNLINNAYPFTQSFAQAGYQKLPSGLIIQWKTGASDPASSTEPSQSITYPIAFPTACLACFVSCRIGSVNNTTDHWYQTCGAPGASSVTVQRQHGGATNNAYTSTTTPVILAIGY